MKRFLVLLCLFVAIGVTLDAQRARARRIRPRPTPSGHVCPPYVNGTTRGEFPDENCTGVLPGIARTNSGPFTTSSNGQVIENLNISGTLTVNHSNVYIHNVKFTGVDEPLISNISNSSTSFTAEDIEVDGTGTWTTGEFSAVNFYHFTVRRANIHHVAEGFGCDDGILIEDSYLHDFQDVSATDAHQDGIQCEGGNNSVIRHNTIIGKYLNGNPINNSAFVFGGATTGNQAEYNLVSGGGWTVYPATAGSPSYLRHNRWSVLLGPPGTFGAIYNGYAGPTDKCDNLWFDGANAGTAVTDGGPSSCPEPEPIALSLWALLARPR